MREDGLYDAFPSIPPSFIPSEPQVIVRVSVEGKVRTRRIHGKGRLTFLDVDIQHSRDAGKEQDGSGAEQGQDGQIIQVTMPLSDQTEREIICVCTQQTGWPHVMHP
mmetsp:Transcript_28525/g.82227  ORF Transcript_28525/g.82227 Transcript_28525/m.82227 type:complete len:107 (-) Transcript_28525:991-1311(-)